MRRAPFFHVVVGLTLALGIGANTAIFGVVKAVLLEPLPYPDAESLVRIWNRHDGRGLLRVDASLQDLDDWRRGTRSFDAFAAWNSREGNLAGDAGPAERVAFAIVSPDFFRAFGVLPALGREFTIDENIPGNDDVAVVSHAFWRDRLGADPSVIGRTVLLDDRPLTIIGVMPQGFAFPFRETSLWKPFGMGRDDGGPRGGRWIDVVARLTRGVEPAVAVTELQTVARANAEAYPDSNEGWSTWLEPLRETIVGPTRSTLWLVWAAAALVLVIACANVANLLLARTLVRDQELAIRTALGADRGRLVRQLVMESLTLALLGGALGVMLARPGVALVARFGESALVGRAAPGVDGGVLVFTLCVSVATGLLMGTLPALRASGSRLSNALRAGGRGVVGRAGRSRRALVILEIALATTIVVGAGLLTRSLRAAARSDVGVAIENRLTLRIAPSWASLPEREQADAKFGRIQDRIRALPGVRAVGAVNRMPLEGPWWTGGITVRGRPIQLSSDRPRALHRVITPGFFEAAGVRLIRGRLPGERDTGGALPVLALSESAARTVFPGEDPIGRVITWEDPNEPTSVWHTVVGIVSDVRYDGLESAPSAAAYTTLAQSRWGHFGDWGMTLVIATASDPVASLAAIRASVEEVDPGLAVYEVLTMRSRVEHALAARRDTASLIAAFALLALALATLGTYAVLAFTISRQRPELGVRIALGATRRDVLAIVMRRGMTPAMLGVGMGLLGATAARPVLQHHVFGVTTLDPSTFAGTASLLLLVSAAACIVPAWRATRIDAVQAIAHE